MNSRPYFCATLMAGVLGWTAAAGSAAEGAAPTRLFPPAARIVLFPGLAGDTESTSSYRAQLQGWLDAVGTLPEPAGQLFVFFDDPARLNLPAKPPATVAKPSRETFLALGASLAGQTNPLVVIAWEHGGMQGRTPVFHVRGPRITAEDFRSLASNAAGAGSRWLLYFRGSGSFARELAGQDRWILSSEYETAFHSDPIGLPLALTTTRTNAGIPFVDLAEDLGRSTAAWYEESKLARTEEPTLWLPGEPPRRLISTEKKPGSTASP